jgi:hypothetical protein
LQKGGVVSRRQFGFLVVVTLIGSTIGGALSGWWLTPSSVKAQKINGVNAEEFLLLDANGKARAGLGLDKNGEVGLVLTSRDGKRKLALSPDEQFVVKLSDQSEGVLWSAPRGPAGLNRMVRNLAFGVSC